MARRHLWKVPFQNVLMSTLANISWNSLAMKKIKQITSNVKVAHSGHSHPVLAGASTKAKPMSSKKQKYNKYRRIGNLNSLYILTPCGETLKSKCLWDMASSKYVEANLNLKSLSMTGKASGGIVFSSSIFLTVCWCFKTFSVPMKRQVGVLSPASYARMCARRYQQSRVSPPHIVTRYFKAKCALLSVKDMGESRRS